MIGSTDKGEGVEVLLLWVMGARFNANRRIYERVRLWWTDTEFSFGNVHFQRPANYIRTQAKHNYKANIL